MEPHFSMDLKRMKVYLSAIGHLGQVRFQHSDTAGIRSPTREALCWHAGFLLLTNPFKIDVKANYSRITAVMFPLLSGTK